jgi:hypothetical protein
VARHPAIRWPALDDGFSEMKDPHKIPIGDCEAQFKILGADAPTLARVNMLLAIKDLDGLEKFTDDAIYTLIMTRLRLSNERNPHCVHCWLNERWNEVVGAFVQTHSSPAVH